MTVPFDEHDRALVVIGNPEVSTPIVYLHGMCADPTVALEAWGSVARTHGTILGLFGDAPCPGRPGRTKWTEDVPRIDARITLAIAAVNRAGIAPPLVDSELIVAGTSMGADRAEALAARAPGRYSRLVLVSSPRTPSPDDLGQVLAVAMVAGELESQRTMRHGAQDVARAGVPARFFLLPGASHGRFGPSAERVMSEAFEFVRGAGAR